MNKNLEIIEFLVANGIDKLYHFTDRANIVSIVKHGGLLSWKECYLRNIDVPVPGGSDLSRILDKRYHLENYVRLSFSNEHPMMFAAVEDGRINDPIILEIDLGVLSESKFKFSDSNAASNEVSIGESKDFLENNIRFELFSEKYYDLDDNERHYYQAEVLINGIVPIRFISNILEFTDAYVSSTIKDEPQINNDSHKELGLRDSILEILNNDRIKSSQNYNKDTFEKLEKIANSLPNIVIAENLPDLSNLTSIELDRERLDKKNHYTNRPKGVLVMMILFGLGYISWIAFVIYCMIYRWTDVQWYDYLFFGLLALLGGFVVVGLPWYLIYWILSKLDIVDPLD